MEFPLAFLWIFICNFWYFYLTTNNNLRLICNHRKVVEKYWAFIREEKECIDYNLINILEISTVYKKDYSKIEQLLINSFRYTDIPIHKISENRNEVIFQDKANDDSFIKIKLDALIEICKLFLFYDSRINLKKVINKIYSISTTRYTFKDIKEYEKEFKRDIYEIQRRIKR